MRFLLGKKKKREKNELRALFGFFPKKPVINPSDVSTLVGRSQVAKMQHQNMECTPAKGCKFKIENGNLSPRGRHRQWRMD